MAGKTALSPSKLRKFRIQDYAVKYYLEGRTLNDVVVKIREAHGNITTIGTCSKYIKAAMLVWRNEQNELIEDRKLQALAKIDNLEVEYWEAWEVSKKIIKSWASRYEPGEGNTEKARLTKKKLKEVTETLRQSAGEAKYLQGIQWCIEKRLEILETLKVVEVEANNSGSTTITQRRIIFTNRKSLESIPEVHVTIEPKID